MKSPRKRQGFIKRGAETDDIWLEDLRGIVWSSSNELHITWKEIALRANIHKNTVANFAYGDTKRPVFRTIFRIAEALDIHITLASTKQANR
jgi:transcriptional regulator with XRE-family HTH domain